MTDEPDGTPPAAAPETTPPPPQGGNGSMSRETMRAAFGPHPMADWRPVIRRRRRR